jgi:hypothetical protein
MYREKVYGVCCVHQGGRTHWRQALILCDVFSGSVTEKVFDNYGCRFAFRASERVETCEFFLSSYTKFSKEQAAIVII